MGNINSVIFLLGTILFVSCEMKTYTLSNGITKVPADTTVYKQKVKFDTSLLSIIDTAVIYEEYSIESGMLKRLDNDITHRFYGVYRFYLNGCLNYFVLDKEYLVDTSYFNPDYDGYRGVYYLERNKIRCDLFAGSNELGWIGKLPATMMFIGDTLYVYKDYSKYKSIYIKRELPIEYFNYKSNW